MLMDESRRRLGSFQICALYTCCGVTKGGSEGGVPFDGGEGRTPSEGDGPTPGGIRCEPCDDDEGPTPGAEGGEPFEGGEGRTPSEGAGVMVLL